MNPLVDALRRRKEEPQEQEQEMPEASRLLSVNPDEVIARPGDPVTLVVQGVMGTGSVSVQSVQMQQKEQAPLSVTTQESHS